LGLKGYIVVVVVVENTAGEAPTINFLLNKNNTNSIQEETKREACLRRATELN